MRIINEKPPVWDSVCATFGIQPVNVLFTYGDIIYNPDAVNIPDHIIVHEEVHEEQQKRDGMTPELWWGKFLRDRDFRLDQESEAYGVQYAFICKYVKDRNQRHKFLHQLATTLSGPLYERCIGLIEAMKLIKERANVV
jgi:hypothetical protein